MKFVILKHPNQRRVTGEVKLSWTVPSGNHAARVEIYRNTSPTFSAENRIDDGKVDLSTSMFIDSQLTNGATYYYKIVLVDSDGFSSSGTVITVTPKMATNDKTDTAIPDDSPLDSIPDNTPNTPNITDKTTNEVPTPDTTSTGNVVPSTNPTPNGTEAPGDTTVPKQGTPVNVSPTPVEITDLFIVGTSNVRISWSAPVDTDITIIRIYDNDVSLISFAAADFSSSVTTYLTPLLSVGPHVFSVGVSDGINAEVKSATRSIEVVGAILAEPVIRPPQPVIQNATVSDHNRIRISWHLDLEPTVNSVVLLQDGVAIETFGPPLEDGSYQYTTDELADGTYQFTVRASTLQTSSESSPVVVIVDDRPEIAQFGAATPEPTPTATTLTIDGLTHTGILPDKVIFNWNATGSSHGIEEFRLFENDTLTRTFNAQSTGFVSQPRSIGHYDFRLEALDITGKAAYPVTRSVDINYLRPITNLTVSSNWISLDAGMAVTLNWNNPSQVQFSNIEIRKMIGSPNPSDPYELAPIGRDTTLILPNRTSHVTSVMGGIGYLDVRVKNSDIYSSLKREVIVYPSTWDRLSNATTLGWENSNSISPSLGLLTNTISVNSAIESGNVSPSGIIKYLEITIPGVNMRNAHGIMLSGVSAEIHVVAHLADLLTDPAVQFKNDNQTIGIPEGRLAGIDISDSPYVTVTFKNPTAAHQIVITPHLSNTAINPGIIDNVQYQAKSNAYRLKFKNGMAEFIPPTGETILGVVEFTSAFQGNIRVLDNSGRLKALYPFSIFFDMNKKKYVNLIVKDSQLSVGGNNNQLRFIPPM